MKLIVALAVLCACARADAATAPPGAPTDAQIERSVESILEQRHPSDTPDTWRRLGPAAPRVIIEMFRKSASPYERVRLVEGLGNFDDPVAVGFLKELGQGTDDGILRNAAVRSVGRSQGARELDFVSGFLRHDDPQTRLAAAQTVQRIDDPKAREILRDYLAGEKTGWIVARVKGQMPRPVGQLTPVASSEDRANAAFNGTWTGFLVAPKRGRSGMRAIELVARFSVEGVTEVKAELQLPPSASIPKKKGASRKIPLGKLEAKGLRVTGAVPEAVLAQLELVEAKPDAKPAPDAALEGELQEQAGAMILRASLPRVGATLLLRREPE